MHKEENLAAWEQGFETGLNNQILLRFYSKKEDLFFTNIYCHIKTELCLSFIFRGVVVSGTDFKNVFLFFGVSTIESPKCRVRMCCSEGKHKALPEWAAFTRPFPVVGVLRCAKFPLIQGHFYPDSYFGLWNGKCEKPPDAVAVNLREDFEGVHKPNFSIRKVMCVFLLMCCDSLLFSSLSISLSLFNLADQGRWFSTCEPVCSPGFYLLKKGFLATVITRWHRAYICQISVSDAVHSTLQKSWNLSKCVRLIFGEKYLFFYTIWATLTFPVLKHVLFQILQTKLMMMRKICLSSFSKLELCLDDTFLLPHQQFFFLVKSNANILSVFK